MEKLKFDANQYIVNTVKEEGESLTYRAYENILYVAYPADEKMQRLSIFVPEVYYEGKTIHGYDLHTAPIFMPNTVGGYMPGPQERPGKDFMGKTNAAFYALQHGYVVVTPGVRGREMQNEKKEYIGCAPAVVCDLKAAVRYLRYNKKTVPGDVEKIISNGTSAGGASSSLLGATGNHPDYEPILETLGAAKERDDIWGASCYCPITNLDHADMAYEWEFAGITDYHGMRIEPPALGDRMPRMTPIHGELSEEQNAWSVQLAESFSDYVNELYLRNYEGELARQKETGIETLQTYISELVKRSAQEELDERKAAQRIKASLPPMASTLPVVKPEEQDWITIVNGNVTDIDFQKYIKFRTRMKQAPAFDNVTMGTPENELFGTKQEKCRHFTVFGRANSKVSGELAEFEQIKMMNPMYYIGDKKATKARYYRIRHGAMDRDTSLAISAMLATELKHHGVDVDLKYPWGISHAGDYDLEELFAWIDEICKTVNGR